MAAMNPRQNERTLDRRSFLARAAWGLVGGIGAVLTWALGLFSLAPAFATRDDTQPEWTAVGVLEEIPEGPPTKRSVVLTQRAGWGEFNTQRLVWVVRRGNELRVFSAVCPHLGCTVNIARAGFFCPCHGSAWNTEGERIGGPTQRGLDELEYKIENNVLYVRYQFFRPNVAEKVSVA